MQIVSKTKSKKVIETIRHKTDIDGLKIVETIVNGGKSSFDLSKKGDFRPAFLDLPEKFMEVEYKDFYDVFKKEVEIESLEDINKYPLYFIYGSGHEMFDADMKIVATPHIFQYIGSLREKCPNDKLYAKLIELLKEHPFVLELSEETIPGYNADFYGQRGLKRAKVLISQEKAEELYDFCTDGTKGSRDWSCMYHDVIMMSYIDHGFNLYGDEITKLYSEFLTQKEYEDDDDDY